jgi:signal transduction histidine kinase
VIQAVTAARRQPIGWALGVAVRPRTYLNLTYLLAAFPLGLGYFVLLITGLSVGVGLLVLGVGALILLLMLFVWWGLARFERELTMWWLGVAIPPMELPPVPGLTPWQRLTAQLRNPVTWKGLVYLLLKFLFGTLAFVLAVTAIAVMAQLLFAPVAYLLGVVGGQTLDPRTLATALLMTLLGVAVGLATLHVVNALAYGWGLLARALLGMSDKDAQIMAARAAAQRERAKAERAEQSRRELIVNASHELRTPIASIRGHVESLLMATEDGTPDGPAPAELRTYLGIVHRETERLSALVDDLLALARAEAGELHLEIRPVDIGGVIEEVYQALAPLARRERQVTLVREVPAGLPPVLADRQRLAQVLLNLVRNAITYTPAGGIVSIAAERADADHLALSVADTGIGIPPEELGRVFERFYRTDASRARASGGFGLGLAIVRDLLDAMGGSITAESVPGQGSRFRVLLRTP